MPIKQNTNIKVRLTALNLCCKKMKPAVLGLMDGSVSTLALLFATAGLTHQAHKAIFVGIRHSHFFSISVLISQNRQRRIEKIREQVEFEINVCAEHEITKILEMLRNKMQQKWVFANLTRNSRR